MGSSRIDPYAPKLYLSKAQIRAMQRAGINLQDLSINMEVVETGPVPETLPHQLTELDRRKIRGHSVSTITFDEFRGEDIPRSPSSRNTYTKE